MNRLLIIIYILLVGWTVGAFAWIGKEMVEQHRIMGGIQALREGSSEQGEKDVLATPEDAPLYLVQELQQEPFTDLRHRLASVLDKATGRSPKPLDPGNVFTPLTNEVATAESLSEGTLEGVDTSWLTDSLRSRLKVKRDPTASQWVMQLVITPEEQKQIEQRVKEEAGALFTNLSERERATIRDQAAYFVKNRWTGLTKEREDRICHFLDSMVRLHYGAGSPEEREKLSELLALNLRSDGEDLLPPEKEWLAEHLAKFLEHLLPDQPWRKTALKVARDYARYGWAPLIEEERVLLEVSLKLRAAYDAQRTRFAQACLKSVKRLVDQGGDVNRVLVTELVSLLGDRNVEVTDAIREILVVLAESRMELLATVLAEGQVGGLGAPEGKQDPGPVSLLGMEETLKLAYRPTKDLIDLLRKTLYREQVPSVMAVRTRTKKKEERKQELERLLRAARVLCAHTLGEVAAIAIRQDAKIPDTRARELFHKLVVEESRRALQGILGSANQNVVAAAQEELKKIQPAALQ